MATNKKTEKAAKPPKETKGFSKEQKDALETAGFDEIGEDTATLYTDNGNWTIEKAKDTQGFFYVVTVDDEDDEQFEDFKDALQKIKDDSNDGDPATDGEDVEDQPGPVKTEEPATNSEENFVSMNKEEVKEFIETESIPVYVSFNFFEPEINLLRQAGYFILQEYKFIAEMKDTKPYIQISKKGLNPDHPRNVIVGDNVFYEVSREGSTETPDVYDELKDAVRRGIEIKSKSLLQSSKEPLTFTQVEADVLKEAGFEYDEPKNRYVGLMYDVPVEIAKEYYREPASATPEQVITLVSYRQANNNQGKPFMLRASRSTNLSLVLESTLKQINPMAKDRKPAENGENKQKRERKTIDLSKHETKQKVFENFSKILLFTGKSGWPKEIAGKAVGGQKKGKNEYAPGSDEAAYVFWTRNRFSNIKSRIDKASEEQVQEAINHIKTFSGIPKTDVAERKKQAPLTAIAIDNAFRTERQAKIRDPKINKKSDEQLAKVEFDF